MSIAENTTTDVAERTDPRWRAVSAEYGIAALRHTHWLDDVPRAFDGAPGLWSGVDGRVRGIAAPGDPGSATVDGTSLAPGEEVRVGRLLLRAIDRDGALALRVLDPESPGRTRLRGIHSFPVDDQWALQGTFVPADEGATRVVRSVDGYEREEPAVGTIALVVDGQPARLTVSRGAHGLSAVIADGSSGEDAYRFRFLPIDLPDADGSVIVDFNRAFLPPCAFSDQYICPLPPAGNRFEVRIEAGERLPDRQEAA